MPYQPGMWGLLIPPDDPVDDAPHLQSAIDASTARGDVLYLSAGTYTLRSQINLTCDVIGPRPGSGEAILGFSGLDGTEACLYVPRWNSSNGRIGGRLENVTVNVSSGAISGLVLMGFPYDEAGNANRPFWVSNVVFGSNGQCQSAVENYGTPVVFQECYISGYFQTRLMGLRGGSVDGGEYTNTSPSGMGMVLAPAQYGASSMVNCRVRCDGGTGIWATDLDALVYRCDVSVGDASAVDLRGRGSTIVGGQFSNDDPVANAVITIGQPDVETLMESVALVEPTLPEFSGDGTSRIHFNQSVGALDMRVWSNRLITAATGMVDCGPAVGSSFPGLDLRLCPTKVGSGWFRSVTYGPGPISDDRDEYFRSLCVAGMEFELRTSTGPEDRYLYIDIPRGSDIFDAVDGGCLGVTSIFTPRRRIGSDYTGVDANGVLLRALDAGGNTLAVDTSGIDGRVYGNKLRPENESGYAGSIVRRSSIVKLSVNDAAIDKLRIEFWSVGEEWNPGPPREPGIQVDGLRLMRLPLLHSDSFYTPALNYGLLGIANQWHPVGSSPGMASPPTDKLGEFVVTDPAAMFLCVLNSGPSVGEPWGWVSLEGDDAWGALDLIS